jgi:hypothetical protein
LLPLYIVIGIIALVVVVGIVVWFVRKRMGGADDRQSLLNARLAIRRLYGTVYEGLLHKERCTYDGLLYGTMYDILVITVLLLLY